MAGVAQAIEQTAESDSAVVYYDVDFGIAADPAKRIAVEVHWPQATMLATVLFCLPGGAMNRGFYNLESADGPSGSDSQYSFARQMAARGLVSVLVDLPGIGESDRPADGYELTPERITSILAQVYAKVCDDLRHGSIDDDLPALPQLQTLGVGHSMGAMLTILQQAREPVHCAIALLGFGTQGLPQFLSEEIQNTRDIHALRARLPTLAKKMFREPYPEVNTSGSGDFYGSSNVEPEAKAALRAARDRLLPVPAFMSMLPGNVAPEAQQIDVPLFLALGDNDFIPAPDADDAGFTKSPAVHLQMLPDTGHSFFLFKSRVLLFDRLAQWAFSLAT